MDGAIIRGQTVVTLGDQLRARWHSSTKYLMLVLAAVFAIGMFNSFRESVHLFPQTLTLLFVAVTIVAATIMIAMICLCLWIVIAAIVALSRLRSGKEQLAIVYAFGPDGIEIRDGRGVTMTTPWSVVAKARERKSAIRLSLKPLGSRTVIKRAFAPDDLQALRALLTQKLGPKARLKPA